MTASAVRSEGGMVAAASPEASEAGAAVLRRGGNAVDAAAAVSLALGVTAPAFSGLGGGGFMLVYLAEGGETHIIDYRETAPRKATADLYTLDADGEVKGRANRIGHLAAGVPGNPAGLALALERFGNMSLAEVAEGAIRYANDGFVVGRLLGTLMTDNHDDALEKIGGNAEMLKADGSAYGEGERMRLPTLGASIERIAAEGAGAFYEGFVAGGIVEEMKRGGGLVDAEDLRTYQPVAREPVRGGFMGYEFVTMPPPSSGGIALAQMLRLLEGIDLKAVGFNTPEMIDTMAQVMAKVYPDRGKVGDPDFVTVPTEEMTSAAYIGKLGAMDSGHTTHFSVMDRQGNVVTMTESLECFFGSGVLVPGTGIYLNDTMHDFDPAPGRPNSVAGGKRPMSSMTPTILFEDGKPVLALGSAGGPRIITAVAQVALNVLVQGMGLQEAIEAPRFHYQGAALHMERSLAEAVGDAVRGRGYEVVVHEDADYYFGGANAVRLAGGVYEGGADPRRDGRAVGV